MIARYRAHRIDVTAVRSGMASYVITVLVAEPTGTVIFDRSSMTVTREAMVRDRPRVAQHQIPGYLTDYGRQYGELLVDIALDGAHKLPKSSPGPHFTATTGITRLGDMIDNLVSFAVLDQRDNWRRSSEA